MPRVKRTTFKEKRFAHEYVKNNGDAAQAYIDAGYRVKEKSVAKAIGYKMLDKPRVQKEINVILQALQLDPASLADKSRTLIAEGLKAKPSFQTAASHIEFLYKVQGISPVNKNVSMSVKQTFNNKPEEFAKLRNDVAELKRSMDDLLTLDSK